MTIRKIKVNGNEYQFVNSSRNTRSGFAHDTTLFKNDYEIAEASCHYLNRTWECYQYQTVMMCCINEEIDREYNRFIDHYKYTNGIKRMTAEKRAEADKEFESREDIKELRKVYKKLNDRD
jgi:hypothetical protein